MAEYKVVEDKQTGEVWLEEETDNEEDESDPFSWFYDLEEDKEDAWNEMSYRRFEKTNRWSTVFVELTDYEEFLLSI